MVLTVNSIGKLALAGLASMALAAPSFAPIAQESESETAAEVAPLTDAEIEASRTLFSQYGCGSCHAFADANGYGSIGPAIDGNATLSVEYVGTIISNGQGAMPSFGGMVSAEEIEILSRYIVAKKAD